MPSRVTDRNGTVIGYLQKDGERIFMRGVQDGSVIGTFGDALDGVLGPKVPDRVPYRDKEGDVQGWVCHEGERVLFRSMSGAISGYYERSGDRILCRGADGSVISVFEAGDERDELFGVLREEPAQKPGHEREDGIRKATPGLLGGCLAAGGWPLVLGVSFFGVMIAWFLAPVWIVVGGLAIWYFIHQLRKPATISEAANRRYLIVALVITVWLELQSIACTASRFLHN